MTRPRRWFSTASARCVRALRTVWTNAWGTRGFTSSPSRCADAARALSSEARPVSSRTGVSGSSSLSLPGQVDPGVVGELVVDHHGGGSLQAVQRQGLGRVRRHEDLDARPLEHRREALPGGLIVIDDQDRVL